jgi:hypothetical protein
MEGRGVGDKPAKKREARLLTKGEQLPYSGGVKALPLAYSGPMSMGRTGGAREFPHKRIPAIDFPFQLL